MKKKLMIGLLTVVTCFTLGSTSFAASDMTKTSNNTTTENVKVAPYASKDIYRGIIYKNQITLMVTTYQIKFIILKEPYLVG